MRVTRARASSSTTANVGRDDDDDARKRSRFPCRGVIVARRDAV
jgi:hypothetical protein